MMNRDALDIQMPPEKVFRVCFGGPNTISGGVWMYRDESFQNGADT